MSSAHEIITAALAQAQQYPATSTEKAASALVEKLIDNIPPLEWHVSDTGDLIADTVLGRYQVQFGGGAHWRAMYAMGSRFQSPTPPTYHKSEEAAKAAAEKDHRETIARAAGLIP